MTRKGVTRLARARQDFDEVVDYYLAEASAGVARRFTRAVREALDRISRFPASGSPRYGHELRIQGLRSRPVKGFPYLVFYVEGEERVEVLRILHGNRDIPASFQDEEA